MLKAAHESGKVLLSGSIDEKDDLSKSIGEVQSGVIFNCKALVLINSVGIKAWFRFFEDLQKKNIAFSFEEFTPILVEQLNCVRNFTCGGSVSSVIAPFRCGSCDQELQVSIHVGELDPKSLKVPEVKCPKCGTDADFDDLEEEFFAFLGA